MAYSNLQENQIPMDAQKIDLGRASEQPPSYSDINMSGQPAPAKPVQTTPVPIQQAFVPQVVQYQHPAIQGIVQTQHPNLPPGVRQNWAHDSVMRIAIMQIASGIFSILFGIVNLVLGTRVPIGNGIWCAVFFIIAGALGVLAAMKKTSCTIVAYMVLSILASFFAFNCLIIESITFAIDDQEGYYYYHYNNLRKDRPIVSAMHAMIIILALLDGIIGIIASSLCCRAVCCGNNARNNSQQVILMTHPSGTFYGQHGVQATHDPYGMPGQTGQFVPLQGQTGQFVPPQGQTGQFVPPQGQTGQFVSCQGQTGQFVQSQGQTGQFVQPQGQTGQFVPPQGQTGQFPPQGQTGQFPSQAQTGQFVPPQGQTGQFAPSQGQTGQFVPQGQTGQLVSTQ